MSVLLFLLHASHLLFLLLSCSFFLSFFSLFLLLRSALSTSWLYSVMCCHAKSITSIGSPAHALVVYQKVSWNLFLPVYSFLLCIHFFLLSFFLWSIYSSFIFLFFFSLFSLTPYSCSVFLFFFLFIFSFPSLIASVIYLLGSLTSNSRFLVRTVARKATDQPLQRLFLPILASR